MALLETLLIVVLVIALIGALPTWGYSRSWGFWPGGLVGLVLIIVILMAVFGVF